MAKCKYNDTFPQRTEAFLKKGHTEKQLARHLGVSEHTLNQYKKQYPQFLQSLKKGKEPVDQEVENALLKRALGFSVEVVEEKVSKDGEIVQCKKEVHYPPEVGAICFWLKNRRPDRWRDIKAQEIDITSGGEKITGFEITIVNKTGSTKKDR